MRPRVAGEAALELARGPGNDCDVVYLGTCMKITTETGQCRIDCDCLKTTLEGDLGVRLILGTYPYQRGGRDARPAKHGAIGKLRVPGLWHHETPRSRHTVPGGALSEVRQGDGARGLGASPGLYQEAGEAGENAVRMQADGVAASGIRTRRRLGPGPTATLRGTCGGRSPRTYRSLPGRPQSCSTAARPRRPRQKERDV